MTSANLYLWCAFVSGLFACSLVYSMQTQTLDVKKITDIMLVHNLINQNEKQVINQSSSCYSNYLQKNCITIKENSYTTDAHQIARELTITKNLYLIEKLLELLRAPTKKFILLHCKK